MQTAGAQAPKRQPPPFAADKSPPVGRRGRSIGGMTRPERQHLRRHIDALCEIHRPSASAGERRAASHVATELERLGFAARIETCPATGNYWLPLGLLSLAGLATGAYAAAHRPFAARMLAGMAAAGAAIGVFDDVSAGRRTVRRLLPARAAHNVVAEFGPADAERTIVVHAHHDAAKSGLIFDPRIPEAAYRIAPERMKSVETGPPVMAPVLGGPALAAIGALTGRRAIAAAGAAASAAITAIMADVALRRTVPGANDNASGVACLLAVAERLGASPLENSRVILLSTGAEESLLEGMAGFASRHFQRLDPARTFFFCLDTVGSQRLCLLRGEGMLRMRDYPERPRQVVLDEAERLGIEVIGGLRHRNSTDALYPLKAGYPAVMLGSVNAYKAPANYHWRSDVPENVDYSSVADAVLLTEATLRRLDRSWLSP